MHQYTKGEEEMIRERWGQVPPQVLADEIGVSEQALVRFARRMGLKLSPGRMFLGWRKYEDDQIRMMAGRGCTDLQIADSLHRSERAVRWRRSKIGA